MKVKTNSLVALIGTFVSVAVLAFMVAILQPAPVNAADNKDNDTKSTNTEETNKDNEKKSNDYVYTAQKGDSYTQMARKAIQTYGINNKVNLAGSQIVFAETKLTQAAGSLHLEQGQKVTIKQSDVKNWVEQAQKLSDAQKAAWNYYVQFVNFNTNNVGQAS